MATQTETFAELLGYSRGYATSIIATSNQAAQVGGPAVSSETSCSEYDDEVFKDTLVQFTDGSRWLIQKPLSNLKLQQTHSPCEARQVFTAQCLEDPMNKHEHNQQAVVKIKFQVQASQDTVQYYQDRITEYKADIVKYPAHRTGTQKELIRSRQALRMCTKPTVQPNPNTFNEILALESLAKSKCPNAPWLLAFAETSVHPGLHPLEIVGGYLVFTLMTELDATPLNHDFLCSLRLEERGELCEHFKTALINVWECGIHPRDTAVRNIMWNQGLGKCYILDFEDCLLLDTENNDKKASEFMAEEYGYWGLDEALFEADS